MNITLYNSGDESVTLGMKSEKSVFKIPASPISSFVPLEYITAPSLSLIICKLGKITNLKIVKMIK